jgi:diguanylate cyclase (GGDEF)-like protein
MIRRTDDVDDQTVAAASDTDMFELAPVSLWLEDYSALKRLFQTFSDAGVTDLRAHLRANLCHAKACSASIRVLKVNRKTLDLFEADDQRHLTDNLDRVFRDDMLDRHIDELGALWDGKHGFQSNTVNYTLGGRRLDIQLRARFLPGFEQNWERVLVSIEDVTDREQALRLQVASENYAKGLFEHSPVSLWVEDFRGVKRLLDDLKARGIENFRTFVDVHPDFVLQCMTEIHVLDVNQHTLTLFAAKDKPTLLNRLGDVFRGNMGNHFKEQLIDLWDGKLFQQREVINYTLQGTELHLHLQFSVLPGYEADWSLVQVALTDITARKKAESYLEFLGKHDVLTRTYNRSFFIEELARLERKNMMPLSVIVADLNGLKLANDHQGHAAGDKLLSRAGEVLGQAVDPPRSAARIGGDEFALVLPDTDEREVATLVKTIAQLVELNNQYHSGSVLSFSIGVATRLAGERPEETIRRADEAMYVDKRAFYERTGADRRSPT